MRRSIAITSLGLLALSLAASGCVPLADRTPARDDIFAPLHDADLSAFDHSLALDSHADREDAWTDVGQAFLAFANCRELERPSERVRDNPEALLVYELIRLEDHRRVRLRRGTAGAGRGSRSTATIHAQLQTPSFFNRDPADVDETLIRWPESSESWPDEWPAATAVDDECDALHRRQGPERLGAPFDDIAPFGLTGRLVIEWRFTDKVRAAMRAVNGDFEPRESLEYSLTAHRADLAVALSEQPDVEASAAALVDELARGALDDLLAIAPDDEETNPIDSTNLAIRTAWLAMTVGDPQLAIDNLHSLVDHDQEAVSNTARYYIVKIAWLEGWWSVAADASPELFDEPASLRSSHAFFASTAHRHDGRDDSFLGLAREALRDRRRNPDDPFLGALYREVLRELVRYEVDERTEELLEEFGPRGELATRQRELAEVALDAGRPEVAEEIIHPLLRETRDARQLPRMQAILALAAFLRDDQNEFDHQIEQLLDHRDGLQEAIPRHRRAAFFAHQDGELARVLRAMLPLMAEWGDDEPSRALRQKWLVAITEHTQDFIRRAPESAVSDNLTELYKLAGQLLDDHPRGYAERVGAEAPSASTLVLGTVNMPPTPPLDEIPRPRLRWPPVYSLLLIPHGAPPPEEFTTDISRPQEES